MFHLLRHNRGFRERDLFSLGERRASFGRQFKHRESFRPLPQIAEPDQLASDGLPLRAFHFLADTVGRNFVVVPFAHVFRVRAHQYIDDVIEAEAEPVFFADSIDARQKFLRGERAVECFTRRQTIVAPAAILLRPFLAEITQ